MRPEITKELERIRQKDGGVLNPHTVLKEARRKNSPLHDQFTWDDSEAAHQYRLWQARELIRVSVTVLEPNTSAVRTYVSLREDRQSGVGYRHLADVLSDEEQRQQLLDQALDDLERIRQKYSHLEELAEVFEAASRVKGRGKKAA